MEWSTKTDEATSEVVGMNPHTGIANLNNITIDSVSYPVQRKAA